jgi:peptide/nickel transport system substrate-binding protein
MKRKLGAICLAVAALGTVVVTGTARASSGDQPVTLTVGLLQDLDSPNVTVGALVADYELWNMQYATLTDKAADDFANIPGLAESWTASADGLTYTYKLRPGLKWSDNEPLTADDIVWTINTSKEQEWINHFSTTQNLTAKAIDPTTVEITTSVPDPKLPTMDVYILPKHIWEGPASKDITAYDALDGVGSGPFTLKSRKASQEWTMVANPNYWGGKPKVDQVVFRVFTEGSAMVAALKSGEIDFVHDVPSQEFDGLKSEKDIATVVGQQGGFAELAMNGMEGKIGDGHPALQDLTVRHAVAMAIDRQALVDRVLLGQGEVNGTLGVSPDPIWTPEIPADQQLNYDPAGANKLLDDAGYKDTNGDGVREMPDGKTALKFRYAQLSDSDTAGPNQQLITGWLKAIGIATEVSTYDQTQLTDVIASGKYDMFVWGWTPFVDPDPMLSYFTCAQITTDAASAGYNDANWCSKDYDALYAKQNQELDRTKRIDLVHQMLTLFYTESTYVVLYHEADTQAYRTDRFTGWTQQPKDIGPVLFTNTSPTYANLRPIDATGGTGTTDSTPTGDTTATGDTTGGSGSATTVASSGDSSSGTSGAGIAAIVIGVLLALGIIGFFVVRSRKQQDDRE